MYLKNIFFHLSVCVFFAGTAQSTLSLEEAIKIALENNNNIIIADNDKKIADSQNNIGNAGMSPVLSAGNTTVLSSQNSYQEFATGVTQERMGARSQNNNMGIFLNWVVFDGLRMFAIKKRLNINEEITDIRYKQEVELTVYNVSIAYFDIVRLEKLIHAAEQNLSIYEEREKISKVRVELGMDARVDLLLIQLDKNKIISDLKRLEQQLIAAKINLNKIITRSVEEDFKPSDSITVRYNPSYDDLKKTATSNNLSLLSSRKMESMMYQYINEARSNLFPIIQINSSYNIIRAQNQAGLLFRNQQNGFNAGLSVNWILFNGFRNSEFVQENKLRYLSQQYTTRIAQLEVDATVYTEYKNFTSTKEILEIDRQNLEFAQSVITISTERYKLGRATLLETKEIQKNLEDAQVRYINSLYDAKVSELELLRASNELVK